MPTVQNPPQTLNPFRLLSEFILLCLGALLLVIAVSGRVSMRISPVGLILVGILFLYMAARAWTKPEEGVTRTQNYIRAASLGIVGILLLNIAIFHSRYSLALLAIAGAVLIVRGLVTAIILVARK
jgi:uncharacterized membrane protein